MIQFKKIEITTHELLDWKRNQLYNPRTSRKIIKKGRLFNYIQEKYNQVFPLGFDIFDSNDERDPISLKYFYKYDLSNNKQLVYTNINNLILYQESESIIRCFEKESIQYLKAYNIMNHPISMKNIPNKIIEDIPDIVINKEMSLEEKALQVFQLFTKISIFIDYKLYLNLKKEDLLTLNYEISEFYSQNVSIADRKKIDKKNRKKYFYLSRHALQEKEEDFIKFYILEQIENIISYPEDDLKFMLNYIVLGGLSLVIKEVKEYYDNFNFSF